MPAENTPDPQAICEAFRAQMVLLDAAQKRTLQVLVQEAFEQEGEAELRFPKVDSDSPVQNPAIHGWRDNKHLTELLQAGIDSGPGKHYENAAGHLAEIKARARARAGLG